MKKNSKVRRLGKKRRSSQDRELISGIASKHGENVHSDLINGRNQKRPKATQKHFTIRSNMSLAPKSHNCVTRAGKSPILPATGVPLGRTSKMSMFPTVLWTSFYFPPNSVPPLPTPAPQRNWTATAYVSHLNLEDASFHIQVHICRLCHSHPLLPTLQVHIQKRTSFTLRSTLVLKLLKKWLKFLSISKKSRLFTSEIEIITPKPRIL